MKEFGLKLIEALKNSLESAAEKLSTAGGSSSDKLMEGLSSLKSNIPDKFSSLQQISEIESVATALDQAHRFKSGLFNLGEKVIGPLLTDLDVYKSILSSLEHFHNHASENPAIKAAMDSLAHVKGYGGAGFHRIADGRHSFLGAFEGVSADLPNIPAIDRILGVTEHLWHDFHSTVGIPIASFASHESFTKFCDALHLSPSIVQDFLSLNSTEVLSSALTIIPVMFRLDEMQAADFAKAAVRVGILTISGGQAEIFGSLFSLAMLGKAFSDVYHEGESYVEIMMEAFKEGGWTTASVVSFGLLPFPVSISVAIVLPLLRAKIEADGIESVLQNSQEYFSAIQSWIQDLDLSSMKQAMG